MTPTQQPDVRETYASDFAWVLRSPCGCPHGASMCAGTVESAWSSLATTKLAEVIAMTKAGWTLEMEPSETAVPDVRARLGTCTHPAAAIARSHSTQPTEEETTNG